MCAAGGFKLTKVVSNSREVLKSINPTKRGKSIKELDLTTDILPVDRALGVHWCIENDSLGFRVVLKDKPATRRGILSTISSIYDPLGLAAPFVLEGKLLLQRLVVEKKDCDEHLEECQKTVWEHSGVVLGYNRNETRRFHLFVSNRATTILDHSRQDQWRYIESEINAADDTTRGLDMESISSDHCWFKGPKILHQPMEVIKLTKSITLDPKDPEVKVNRISITPTTEKFIERLASITNSWQKLKRILCIILCYKPNLPAEDLAFAETKLIQLAQSQFYYEEIECHKTNKPIPRSSSIVKLDPLLDENRILRVGGRLLLDNNPKHPIILSKRSKFSLMIAQHCHSLVHHAGRGITINEI
ncbi:uncharacterized protein [Clytia hemisphaerica]|uniref:uncharacterized protein n=1 Tax=Clytia hemisphaerica TaxID=252671 RepID=UPI0034D73100